MIWQWIRWLFPSENSHTIPFEMSSLTGRAWHVQEERDERVRQHIRTAHQRELTRIDLLWSNGWDNASNCADADSDGDCGDGDGGDE